MHKFDEMYTELPYEFFQRGSRFAITTKFMTNGSRASRVT